MAAEAPAIPPVLSATQMPKVVQNPLVVGRDGNYSMRINGVAYWAFNDTAMSQANATGENFIDNTISVGTVLDDSLGLVLNKDQVDRTGALVRFIPFTQDEVDFQATHEEGLALWPGPIVYEPKSKTVIVPFGRIIRGGKVEGYPSTGSGISLGRVLPNGELKMLRPIQNPGSADPTLLWSANEQAFTDEAFILGDYYYAYGGHNVFVSTELRLARVPVKQLLEKSAWTYFAGHGLWSRDVRDAADVFSGGATGSSVFYNAYLGEWMAIYSGNFTNFVYYRVASGPEGPWSAETLLFTGKTPSDGAFDYAAHAHPEYTSDGGKTIDVTYVRGNGQFLGQDLELEKVVFGKP